MTHLTHVTKSNVSKAGAAFLMLALGVACGDGGNTRDGSPADGRNTSDGRDRDVTASKMDSGNTPDRENGGDNATPGDGGSELDGAVAGRSDIHGERRSAPHVRSVSSHRGVLTPRSPVTADPAAATYITGFSLAANPASFFSTSPQVTGRVYAANHTPPTPSNLTTSLVSQGNSAARSQILDEDVTLGLGRAAMAGKATWWFVAPKRSSNGPAVGFEVVPGLSGLRAGVLGDF